MSWIRAGLVGLVTTIVAVAVLIVVPNALVTLSGMARGTRVLLATAWFTIALVVLAWALRRLQDKHIV